MTPVAIVEICRTGRGRRHRIEGAHAIPFPRAMAGLPAGTLLAHAAAILREGTGLPGGDFAAGGRFAATWRMTDETDAAYAGIPDSNRH